MSMDKNPQALAQAFKKCAGKIMKIKELKIVPDLDEDAIETLIEMLAVAKAKVEGNEMSKHVKGQRWYVENLVKFSGLSTQEQFDSEYDDSFADTAPENELLKALEAMAA